ncbi:MAG: metal ABC transporter ATP-binding protein [Syntrophaceticus sp.]
MKVLQLQNIYFTYSDRLILEEIDLVVEKGEILALIGPNGSGKTTLVKLILGLLKLTQGEILLFGTGVDQFKEWHRVGYVPQRAEISGKFPVTAREVAATGRFGRVGLCHRLGQDDWKAVEEALDMVGLLSLQHQPIIELSGGQQQRVFIARALAGQPDILILDEPQVGLDDRYIHDFYQLLLQLNKEQEITVFIVSHDVGVLGALANRIACLNRRLICQGSPQEVLTAHNLSYIYGNDYSTAVNLG